MQETTLFPKKKPGSAELFQSFFFGGFECATHRRVHTGRIDVCKATRHDACAAEDYALLASCGVRSVRDGLRWHLIERTAGYYDWSSFLPMLRAAIKTGTQVLWDLCHWGVPDGLDPFSPEFCDRFERFSAAAARIVREETDDVPFFCPINEISFWSWIGGDRGAFFPYGEARGDELKRCLVRAAIASTRAVREVSPQARFLQCEPIIHIAGAPGDLESTIAAERHTASQFAAWDMLCGRQAPELGGDESCLDIVGCNYYWNNQWIDHGEMMPIGHARHRPLHWILGEVYARYGRPMVISETGAEGDAGAGWLGMISSEARLALKAGVDLQGICLYPVTDYPGWDDCRHCACGLIEIDSTWQTRTLRAEIAAEIALQDEMLTRSRLERPVEASSEELEETAAVLTQRGDSSGAAAASVAL